MDKKEVWNQGETNSIDTTLTGILTELSKLQTIQILII